MGLVGLAGMDFVKPGEGSMEYRPAVFIPFDAKTCEGSSWGLAKTAFAGEDVPALTAVFT